MKRLAVAAVFILVLSGCDSATKTSDTSTAFSTPTAFNTPTTSQQSTFAPPIIETPDTPTVSTAPIYYGSCAAVRAAGKSPLYFGQPGYRRGLDADGDGVACEAKGG